MSRFHPQIDVPLSQAAAAFMREVQSRGLCATTAFDIRDAVWAFFEFVGRDARTAELSADAPERFLDWLRSTPVAPRKRAPERDMDFNAQSVRQFFDRWIAWRCAPRRRRSEGTVKKYWLYIAPFFASLDPNFWPQRVFESARENGRKLAEFRKEALRAV